MKLTKGLPTPYYLIDESLLIKNLEIIKRIKDLSGAKVLLAQKAFSSFYFYPILKKYLDGTASSGLYEAKLGKEHFGKEVHVFTPGFKDEEFPEILKVSDHIVFNSNSQLTRFKSAALKAKKTIGIRINPEVSTQKGNSMYDPCSPTSRMGIKAQDIDAALLTGVSGFHFHTLCQQNSDDLATTLSVVEKKFSQYFPKLKWINFGGGHHLTRKDYDIEKLVRLIKQFKAKYNLEVYLEPGEAVVLNAGFLVSRVLDVTKNDVEIAILDASATCHMPDVIEAKFIPPVTSADPQGKHIIRLSGATCLTGDDIGIYRFKEPLKVGDYVIFEDMALYTIVKNNTFNGIPLPSIYARKTSGKDVLVKSFNYRHFKEKLS
ncbi:MAG: carboxynorspermidine decarboxylase [Bacilli bacterium]